MAENSKIEWTDTTWNPIAGCTPVSEGCRNCYAANHARRLAGNPNPKVSGPYEGTARTAGDGRAVFTGRVNLLHDRLGDPLHWRKPRRVFVNAMSDLFHPDVPDEFIRQVWWTMAQCDRRRLGHVFQILTKRPDRMAEWVQENVYDPAGFGDWTLSGMGGTVLPNVWLGTSVEDQPAADERIPYLLRCPAAVRFLSCEPLLGPVELRHIDAEAKHRDAGFYFIDPLTGQNDDMGRPCRDVSRIDWVIAGGESGPKARPCDVEWIRSLVRQCQAAEVPAFVKQLGARPYSVTDHIGPIPKGASFPDGFYRRLSDHKGGDPSEWPADLRVREFPEFEVAE